MNNRAGFVLSSEQFAPPDLVRYGVLAEQAGFHAAWVSDHFHPWQDNQGHSGQAWVTLAALGQATSRLTIGTGVTCPIFRYRPAVTAQAFATLGVLFPGRVFLGVGSGEALNELPASGEYAPASERISRLAEAAKIIRRLWSGEWVDFDGRYYQVRQARLYDLPDPPVPLYISGAGPRSTRIAGRLGDGWVTLPGLIYNPELRAAFQQGAREAGKDPVIMPVLAEHFVIVGTMADAQEAARLWRFAPIGFSQLDEPDPRLIQRRAERQVDIDRVLDGWLISEDPAEHATGLQKAFDAGATEVYVHSPQADQRRVIEFYGQQVLPQLNGR
jgi:F420-dependent hydroxymycolic acid dehydrogenase